MSDQELLTFLQKIQHILVDVSTGGSRILDVEEAYGEIYFKLANELQERECDNPNPFSSLWDYYSYWSEELPTYQSRRDYIRNMYKTIEDNLRKNLVKAQSRKAAIKSDKQDNYSISFDDLHEDIVLKCKDLFLQGKRDDAVHNAFKLLEVRVREKAELSDSDLGVKLMRKAFAPTQTQFIIAEDTGEVHGWMELYAGSIGALKNPTSHRFSELPVQDAFQMISFASFLLKSLETFQIREKEIDLSEIPF